MGGVETRCGGMGRSVAAGDATSLLPTLNDCNMPGNDPKGPGKCPGLRGNTTISINNHHYHKRSTITNPSSETHNPATGRRQVDARRPSESDRWSGTLAAHTDIREERGMRWDAAKQQAGRFDPCTL